MSKLNRMIMSLFFLGMLAAVTYSQGPAPKKAPPALQGELDLSQWNFLRDGPVSLEGDWLFFPNRLLTEDIAKEPWEKLQAEALRIPVPGFFVNARHPDGRPASLPMTGYGSYLLRIRSASQPVQFALAQIRTHASARILTFNIHDPAGTKQDIALGEPGADAATSYPHITTLMPTHLNVKAGEDFYILIQMSNFFFSKGGISPAPTLNEAQSEHQRLLQERTLVAIMIGISLALASYNFTLFMRNHRDLASLYLSAFCLLIVWRTVCPFLFDRPGFLDLEIQYKTFYMTMVLPLPFFGYFLALNFARQTSRRFLKVLTTISLLYAAFVLVTPTGIFSHTVMVGQITLFLGCLYFVWAVFRATLAGELGALFSLIGCLCIAAGVFCDILDSRGFRVGNGMSAQYGLVAFLFMQSQIVGIRFASAFRTAEHLGKKLQDEVDRQTRDIRSILQSIRQGIFLIKAKDRKTDHQTSAYLKEILNSTDLEGKNINEILLSKSRLSLDERNQVEETVNACLGESLLSYELNEGNLIKEISLQAVDGGKDRILEVDWAPILDRHETAEKMLVCLRDVTEIRNFQQEARQKDLDLQMVLEILNVPEDRFQRFMKHSRNYLDENRQLIHQAEERQPELIKRLFVNMHTVKGGARSYMLKTLSDRSHLVEQSYVHILQGQGAWNQAELLAELDGLETVILQYLKLAEEKLGWNLQQRDIRMAKDIVEHTIASLEKIRSTKLNAVEISALNMARSMLVEHCSVRLSHVISELKPGLQSMARDLGKDMPEISVDEGQLWLHEKAGNILHSCLIHLLRNAIDHGIEKTEERLRAGKDPKGRLLIQAYCEAEQLCIDFSDDGRGLNLERIQALGVKRGLIAADEQDPQRIAQLILQSGFTTKTAVSEISGRGVGMDAIHRYVQDHQGSLQLELQEIQDRRHVPFLIRLTLPRALCVEIDSELGNAS